MIIDLSTELPHPIQKKTPDLLRSGVKNLMCFIFLFAFSY